MCRQFSGIGLILGGLAVLAAACSPLEAARIGVRPVAGASAGAASSSTERKQPLFGVHFATPVPGFGAAEAQSSFASFSGFPQDAVSLAGPLNTFGMDAAQGTQALDGTARIRYQAQLSFLNGRAAVRTLTLEQTVPVDTLPNQWIVGAGKVQ